MALFNPSMPSQMSHTFSRIPAADIPRSSFRRPFSHKTTFDGGFLIPLFVDEVLPGDTFNVNMTGFVRMLSPLQVPVMDNAYLDTFFFFVPNRLVWDNWQKFQGEQRNPGDSTDYLVPQMLTPEGGVLPNTLTNYMGILTSAANVPFDSLWHRAYNLIWNEWFRDENLQNSVVVDLDDGPDNYSDYQLLRRGKRHDYFTSGLPWPQKGDAVDIPFLGNAPIIPSGTQGIDSQLIRAKSDGSLYNASGLGSTGAGELINESTVTGVYLDPNGTLVANMSDAAAVTINALRTAVQVQRLYERDARGGTRYTEIVRSHFGVVSPDARLQRPEYLGGGSTPINISPIPQTSSTAADDTPQANLAAIGSAVLSHDKGNRFVRSFTEHGVILGLVSARADLTYQAGIPRMFSRQTRFDFYMPVFSHLGEQVIKNKEIYCDGSAADDEAFAYAERWAEYRYKNSLITGTLNSNAPGSLDVWHLAQDFDSLPALNAAFIEEHPPFDRIVAVQDEPIFVIDAFFDIVCARPMPTFSVPGLMDHF